MSIVSQAVVSLKIIVHSFNFMYGEFKKQNCVLCDTYMLHLGLRFGWLPYLEVGRGS